MLTALPKDAAKRLNLKEHTNTVLRTMKKWASGEEASGTA
jgi:hypothetical protein